MLTWAKALLSEGSEVSTMRVMALLSLNIGGSLAVFGMWKGVSLSELSILCGVFVGAAFGGKVLQKKAET